MSTVVISFPINFTDDDVNILSFALGVYISECQKLLTQLEEKRESFQKCAENRRLKSNKIAAENLLIRLNKERS